MKNTNIIFNLKFVQKKLRLLTEVEEGRLYCRHDLYHFLSVARICYILNLEHGLNLSKDLIYTTSLLHDLGKIEQYIKKIPHEKASIKIAKKALRYTDFNKKEKKMIISAIKNHRGFKYKNKIDFDEIFKRADNLSRDCYNCKVERECSWDRERKNLKIIY